MTASGPDFLCIGAQKAGTGWLYEQLRHHPDFWMPPMKELHYFDRIAAQPNVNRSLGRPRKEEDRIRIARDRIRDQRDDEFLNRFEKLAEHSAIDPRRAQTNAALPVIARPTMSVFISRVPS